MTESLAQSAHEIRLAMDAAKRLKPAYEALLTFYGRIITAQAEAQNQVSLEPIDIPADILKQKARAQMPLIAPAQFRFDADAARRLFRQLLTVGKDANPVLARNLAAVSGPSDDALDEAFRAFLAQDQARLEAAAARWQVDAPVFSFLVYNSLKPSILLCTQQLAPHLKAMDPPWTQGYCPICGLLPAMSCLQDEGQRHLHCSFCWHAWRFARLRCPFCGNHDIDSLNYFFSPEDKEHRVETCGACGQYIKTVDARHLARRWHPALEHVLTLHLDVKAREMGFKSAVAMGLDANPS